MYFWWSVLLFGLLASDEILHVFWCFINYLVELRFKTSPFTPLVDLLVCFQEFFLLPVFDGDAFNEVWIIDVKNTNLLITFVGYAWKFACLVSGDEALSFSYRHVD